MARDSSDRNRSRKREGKDGVSYGSTRFNLGVENERSGAGQDGQTEVGTCIHGIRQSLLQPTAGMVDYSRFDHIGSDSDEDDGGGKVVDRGERRAMANPSSVKFAPEKSVGGASSATSGLPVLPQPTLVPASKKGKEGRIKFEYEGKTVYEWEQSLEEVNLYIEPPRGLKAEQIECTITPRHLRLGIKGNPPFIDEDTGGPVVVEESYWMMDGGELNVNLQKMKKAETWPAALQGRNAAVDPATLEGMQKKIMLERFQSENPGFDFSGAEFNGQIPDARTFMGGVKYT